MLPFTVNKDVHIYNHHQATELWTTDKVRIVNQIVPGRVSTVVLVGRHLSSSWLNLSTIVRRQVLGSSSMIAKLFGTKICERFGDESR